MNIDNEEAVKMATDYLMDEYDVNYDESISIIMSNPDILTPLFGLKILAHYLNKSWEKMEKEAVK